eukprot:1873822-Heterocapsa_arctica.AAC.1
MFERSPDADRARGSGQEWNEEMEAEGQEDSRHESEQQSVISLALTLTAKPEAQTAVAGTIATSTASTAMEEDALDRGEQSGTQMTLRDQTAVNNYIVATNFVTPT